MNDTLNAIAERRLWERTRRSVLITSQLNATAADALGRMRSDVFRMGVIYPETLNIFLGSLSSDDKINVQDAFFLISCCGSALPECVPSERMKLLQKVWDILPSHGILAFLMFITPSFHLVVCQGVEYNLDDYNARLVVAKENGVKISSDQFLSEMAKAGIEPSQTTYELLIAHCCQDGDIKEATRLLELLKEKKMPINERVFASLINGYLKANDEANASAIEELMKSRGLRPGSLTYVAKLLAYAEQADRQKIEAVSTIYVFFCLVKPSASIFALFLNLFCEVNSANIFLSDDDVLEAACILAKNGHDELIDQVLANLRKQIGFTHKAKNASIRLASLGLFEASYKVMQTVNKANDPTRMLVDVGDRLLRHMVKIAVSQAYRQPKPVEVIGDFCRRMENDGLHRKAFASALRLIRQMAVSGVALRPQYFWPLICMEDAAEGHTVKTLELMLEMNVPITMTTMADWFWSHSPSMTVETLSKLPVGAKLGQNFVSLSYLCHLMKNADANSALEFANKNKSPMLSVGKVTECLLTLFGRDQNHEVTVALLERLNTMLQVEPTAAEFNGDLVIRLSNMFEAEQLNRVLENMIARKLPVSEIAIEYMISRGKLADNSEIVEKLRLVASSGEETAAKAPDDTADKILSDFTTGGRDVSIRAERLLQRTLAEKKYDEAVKLYNFLKENYPSSAVIFDKHMITLCARKSYLDEALSLFRDGLENRGLRDSRTAIDLAMALVSGRRFFDAVDVLKSHRSFMSNINTKAISYDVNQLLTKACECGNVEELCDLVEALLESGYSVGNNMPLLKCARVLLANGDLKKAVDFFDASCVRFRRLPFASELLVALIQAENSALLQRGERESRMNNGLYDLIVEKRGESSALTMLTLALISARRIEQAEQLLKKRDITFDSGQLTAFCRNRVLASKVRDLESLLTVTRDMPAVSRDLLYCYLLIAYRNSMNWRNAADAWNRMKEENFNPSRRLLLLFQKIFSECKQQPPDDLQNLLDGSGFADSILSEGDLLSSIYASLPSCEVNALLNQGNIDAAADRYYELGKSGQAMPVQLSRRLFGALRNAGNYETMAKIRRYVSSVDARYLNLNFMISEAMIESGNVEAFLKPLENNPASVVSSGLFAFLLECQPDLEERVKAYSVRAMAKGNVVPKVGLWVYYVAKGREEEANAIMTELGEDVLTKNMRYMYLVQQARSRNRPELVKQILLLLKRHTPEQLSSAVGYIINLDLSAGRLDSLKEMIEFAQENKCTESGIYRRAIQRIDRGSIVSDSAIGNLAEDSNEDEDLIVDKEAIPVREKN
ncbi:PPR 3 and PPR domain containing protein [Trichuris trichiura]|uniref:PPR 3 and PPR domain containing protein n=1 Tax=Trichuris trichiura TaxID=36087 RepID=A0A077Z2R3_TRITR|nr:PPR 3 and PPR domain containing protein [Trichuris trichiura]